MPKVVEVIYPETKPSGVYMFECGGCKHVHQVFTKPLIENKGQNPVWDFNGDLNKPTFRPSLLVYKPKYEQRGVDAENKPIWVEVSRETICHSFITDGKIQYLGDCKHELRGQTIELDEIE